MLRAALALMLVACVDQPSGLTDPDIGIPTSATAETGIPATENARATVGLRKTHTRLHGRLDYQWGRPADTVGLVGYEYRIHDRGFADSARWERSGTVPDSAFAPCRTSPDWLLLHRWQFAQCTHATGRSGYAPLDWVRLYDFQVRAVYADSARGPVAIRRNGRPRRPPPPPPPPDSTVTPPPPVTPPPVTPPPPPDPPAPSPCERFHALHRASVGEHIVYSGECHSQGWTFFTVDAREIGSEGAITLVPDSAATAVCGHNNETHPGGKSWCRAGDHGTEGEWVFLGT